LRFPRLWCTGRVSIPCSGRKNHDYRRRGRAAGSHCFAHHERTRPGCIICVADTIRSPSAPPQPPPAAPALDEHSCCKSISCLQTEDRRP
jgi:hypothetical protein